VVSALAKRKSAMYLKFYVLSRFYGVAIDGVWIVIRI
jgi:hypothetical protein